MKIFKIILKLLIFLSLVAYLVYAFMHLTGKGDQTVCDQVVVRMNDAERGFITPSEVDRMLQDSLCYPVGVTMQRIDGKKIEEVLLKNPYIETALCYKGAGGIVHILLEQHVPLMRVLADNGEDYYLTETGVCLPPLHYRRNLLVATGTINQKYATTKLRDLALFVEAHDFWNAQFEQAHVATDGKVLLYPRIGKQIIKLGKVERIETKMANLKLFYDKVMPVVGWNKYKELNIAHVNQVIGVRK